jgi:hypothetical protein
MRAVAGKADTYDWAAARGGLLDAFWIAMPQQDSLLSRKLRLLTAV